MNEDSKVQLTPGVPSGLPLRSGPPPRPTLRMPVRERSTLARILPTDRLAFDKQKELLRAFAAEYAANGGQPVTNDKAGEIIGLSGSTISQTNGFFCDVGLLVRSDQGGFVPSNELVEYNNACQWDESEARLKLRPIFERTWFYRCLIPRLHLSPQSKTICLSVLASESKAQPEHNERLLNLISFLELAGVVSESGGMVSLQQSKPPVHSVQTVRVGNNLVSAEIETKEFSDPDQHTLYLSADKKRKVMLGAPLSISNAEYKRICDWIKVTLIVNDDIAELLDDSKA